jgi:hypothetical protein
MALCLSLSLSAKTARLTTRLCLIRCKMFRDLDFMEIAIAFAFICMGVALIIGTVVLTLVSLGIK